MAKERHNKKYDDAPTTIKVISILYYIAAALFVFMGLVIIIGSKPMASSIVTSNPGMGLDSIPLGALATIVIVIGVVMLGISVFCFFIGRGIWRTKKWARITAIILSILGIISAVFSIFIGFKYTQIISLIIDIFIAVYLLFSKEAKIAFKK